MLTLTCCQDQILTENIWFVCLETSNSGDERRCHGCGTTNNRTTEDRATQPMEAGGWVSQYWWRTGKKTTCTLPRQCGAPRLEDPRISSVRQDHSSPTEKLSKAKQISPKTDSHFTHPCPHLFWLNSGMVNAIAFHPPVFTVITWSMLTYIQ